MSAKDAQQVSLQSLYHPNDTLEVFTAKLKSVTNQLPIASNRLGISKKDMLAKAKKYFIHSQFLFVTIIFRQLLHQTNFKNDFQETSFLLRAEGDGFLHTFNSDSISLNLATFLSCKNCSYRTIKLDEKDARTGQVKRK